ncbi:MAG: carbamoyl-phosphate synthase large subunit [Candidatus Eisenbacteria bacterium]|uniref:Carbamoyl phosphate synthase large chain n=2 Tax=Eiseniibacteriota bacterium TaxID=2212470 RepID=A0A538SDQ3_UNCEI|nr:MAG: carbamoyl-phosphate synthase large subunit [Candidatus Eisenbacteria bacterium]
MPKDPSIRSVLVIGSGPIVIGQACEFDYSGTQAVKVLRQQGIRVSLVNSNPATIMTDPEYADRTYVEPLTPDFLEKILLRERPDAVLPTVGGQTALNLAFDLSRRGVLDRLGIRLIGASRKAVEVGEDRRLFKEAMSRIGLDLPRSGFARNLEEAVRVLDLTGLPAVIRPSFTLGGSGGGIAYNKDEFEEIVARGLDLSPVHEILVEESVLGWKEYELEVMRDHADNFVVICSIENFDPMGIHTGDSVTVAPAQTLTDREYQAMRNAARRVIREVGVETGGSNIQFAVDPKTGRMVVIEMNPRVSRSSALASKATGFPIAKIAALLAIGYTLDEIRNDITRVTPASFEPAIDYVVVKIPRWAFEKFRNVNPSLGTQMKSVGEVMAIGRTFKEALQKGLRGLEIGASGFSREDLDDARIQEKLLTPDPDRIFYVKRALDLGWPQAKVHQMTGIDPWFLDQIQQIVDLERRIQPGIDDETLREAKRMGFSDSRLGVLTGAGADEMRARRMKAGIVPVYKRVDTCAAEFESHTPYLYSTYEEESEAEPTSRRKVMILGSGPNRIGQGIEFDYCCCHGSFAFQSEGYETIMVNCNPETVSTDYDTSDRLYFEPLTFEDVMNIIEVEKPEGVVIQFGGQTPLKLALPLHRAGVRILGTSPDAIDLAEDRKRFSALLRELGIPQPESGTAVSLSEAKEVAARIGYPVLVRPSYVLGGRAMAIVYDESDLEGYVREAVSASPEHPVLVDRFLEDAFEVDVDALGDGTRVVIGGIMQHIEEAGIHSGDSSAVLPSYKIGPRHLETIRDMTRRLGLKLGVRGLMNVQFAIQSDIVYVLEVNPRASRTVPFVSKATGVPLAKVAARIMAGRSLEEQGMVEDLRVSRFYIKTPVFPFMKFPGSDILLGPEMKSTGEVMGISEDFGIAFAKAQAAAGNTIPTEGTAFLSVNDRDKRGLLPHARGLHETGFHILATQGTAEFLNEHGVPAELVFKVNEGRPNIVDRIKSGGIQLIINTPLGRESFHDDGAIRTNALLHGVLCVTTLTAAAATVQAIRALRLHTLTVSALQELHPVPISTPVPADPAPAPSPPNPAIPLTTGAA